MGLITSPITGAAVTGLTSPTYTLSVDNVAANQNGVAYYVSALGGTQAGVRTHSVSSPFRAVFTRPLVPKTLGTPNPSTGVIPQVPFNKYGFSLAKGLAVAANQPLYPAYFRGSFDIPAGAETFDVVNMAALFSCAGGLVNGNATSLYNLAITGTMVS